MELFRIVATFMILILHHNGWFLNDFGQVGGWWANGNNFALTRSLIQAVTCIGVDCFVLISGYFSIKPKGKSLLNMFTILVFFYLGTYILGKLINGDTLWHPSTIMRTCLAFSRENWFIQCYLFLILLAPVLNAFIEKCSERKLAIYIGIFGFCAFYFGCVHNSEYFYFNRGYSVTTFALVYLAGRYLRLYGQKRMETVATWKLFLVWCVCTIVMMTGYLYIPEWSLLWCYCSPIQIISASLLLLLFSRIRLQNKIVNWIGVSCLAVFILHTCSPLCGWLIEADIEAFNTGSLIYWLGVVLRDCVCVFAAAILLDKIRIWLTKPIMNLYDKVFNNCICK